MVTITIPVSRAFRPSEMEWAFRDNARRSGKSSETGTVQWSERPGASLVFQATWTNQTRDQRMALFAKLVELHGHINLLQLPFFPRPTPKLPCTGNWYLTNTIGQGANQCAISGFGTGSILSPGDFINIGGQLVLTTACALSGGNLTTTFAPRVRVIMSANTTVTYHWPTGVFRLAASSREIRVPFGPDIDKPFSAEFEEAFQ